ncbi:MAG: electron transport complex subunit E [Firmicutes bacterium]|nr:electron transport complex subunit E [Bacillota bacterium]
MSNFGQHLTRGILHDNPVFRLVLGMCPTLAITVLAVNALGMGLSVIVVLVCSNVVISLLREVIPSKVRIPAYIIIIATFVTLVDMLLNAFSPDLHRALGIFIPLIVVNCIILGRAEAFARKHPVLPSLADGLAIGVGYTLTLLVLATIREVFGSGTFFGLSLFGESFQPMLLLASPPGAFITLGLLMAAFNYLYKKLEVSQKKRRSKQSAGDVTVPAVGTDVPKGG